MIVIEKKRNMKSTENIKKMVYCLRWESIRKNWGKEKYRQANFLMTYTEILSRDSQLL